MSGCKILCFQRERVALHRDEPPPESSTIKVFYLGRVRVLLRNACLFDYYFTYYK